MQDHIRAMLAEPFPAEAIKCREGRGGKMLDYLEGWRVIERLNAALGSRWDFDIVAKERIEETGEVMVTGRMTIDGISKPDIGTDAIEYYKGTSKPISLGDAYKSATTDCIKRCARLFGVGLELYRDDLPKAAPEPKPEPKPQGKPPAKPKRNDEAAMRSTVLGAIALELIDERADGRHWKGGWA